MTTKDGRDACPAKPYLCCPSPSCRHRSNVGSEERISFPRKLPRPLVDGTGAERKVIRADVRHHRDLEELERLFEEHVVERPSKQGQSTLKLETDCARCAGRAVH